MAMFNTSYQNSCKCNNWFACSCPGSAPVRGQLLHSSPPCLWASPSHGFSCASSHPASSLQNLSVPSSQGHVTFVLLVAKFKA